MPKGQFHKLKGATVDLPVDVSETIKKVPRTDGLILLKLISSEEPKSEDFEEGSNCLDSYRQASNDSLIMDNSVFDIVPGKDKEIKSILLDAYCEELAFPSLFFERRIWLLM